MHGVGILLNKRWKRQIVATEYVSERMITTTIKCDQRKIELTSGYFLHSGHEGMHIENMFNNTKTHCNNNKHTRIIAGNFNAQVGLGIALCGTPYNIRKTPENISPSDPQVGKRSSWTTW